MSKSPTLHSIKDSFSSIKRKLGLKKDNISKSIIFSVLYIFLTFVILIYFKPRIICNKKIKYDEYNEYNEYNEYKISYTKFLLFLILLNIPLFIYFMISF